MKYLIISISLLALIGCAEVPTKPTQPIGHSQQINSLPTAEMLVHEAGYMIVGPKRHERNVRETFLYNGQRLIARPESMRRQFKRDLVRQDYALLAGAQLLPRTVLVSVPTGKASFVPTYKQRVDMLQLASVADRIEVRGRTDGMGDRDIDQLIARQRAESGKRYLIDLGVPNNIISVNYLSAGDYIADNSREGGRRKNRRVELEFFIDDFTTNKPPKFKVPSIDEILPAVQKSADNQRTNQLNVWQEIGADEYSQRANQFDIWREIGGVE